MNIGLELALTGMGTVFSFLILLIFVTSFMSRLLLWFDQSRFAAKKTDQQTINSLSEQPKVSSPKQEMPSELLIAVVTAAIHQHCSRTRD